MILIDASHLFFRQLFMNLNNIVEFEQNDIGEKVPTGEINDGFLIHLIFNNVLSFSSKFGGSKENPVIVCCDSKPSWRHQWYVDNSKNFPEYKGETYKGDRKKDLDIPWDKIWEAFGEGLDALDALTDFIVMKVDLCEADDIIAILAKHRPLPIYPGEDYVCSSDKDFRQLQTEKCHIFDPIKKIIIPPIDIERYKQLHFLLAGDDNIKQVKKGVGPKTAEKMLKELDIVLQTNPDIRERYEFNRTLIDFDYIPENLRQDVFDALANKSTNSHSPGKLLTFFSSKKMRKLATRIPEFALSQKSTKKPRIPTAAVSARAETSIEDFFNS